MIFLNIHSIGGAVKYKSIFFFACCFRNLIKNYVQCAARLIDASLWDRVYVSLIQSNRDLLK